MECKNIDRGIIRVYYKGVLIGSVFWCKLLIDYVGGCMDRLGRLPVLDPPREKDCCPPPIPPP